MNQFLFLTLLKLFLHLDFYFDIFDLIYFSSSTKPILYYEQMFKQSVKEAEQNITRHAWDVKGKDDKVMSNVLCLFLILKSIFLSFY